MRPPARSLALLLAAAALASCTEPTAAERAAGVYVLQRVAGDALPTTSFATESFHAVTIADTIELRADGTGRQTRRMHVDVLTPPTSTLEQTLTMPLVHRVTAGVVEIRYVCPPNALCADLPSLVGVLTGDGLRIDYLSGGGRMPQEFVAVAR